VLTLSDHRGGGISPRRKSGIGAHYCTLVGITKQLLQ
jgi:hypothetical protein